MTSSHCAFCQSAGPGRQRNDRTVARSKNSSEFVLPRTSSAGVTELGCFLLKRQGPRTRPLFLVLPEIYFFAVRRSRFTEQLGLHRVREGRLGHLGQHHFAGTDDGSKTPPAMASAARAASA